MNQALDNSRQGNSMTARPLAEPSWDFLNIDTNLSQLAQSALQFIALGAMLDVSSLTDFESLGTNS